MSVNTGSETLHQVFHHIADRHVNELGMAIDRYRRKISHQIATLHGHVIQHGPFAGMSIDEASHWSSGDKATMVLGLYECEVLKVLTQLSSSYGLFINLGAADGYYAIGSVFGGLFPRAVAFEITQEGQSSIRLSAEKNKVSHLVQVLGKAEKNFTDNFSRDELHGAVVLCDIEGGEFDIFDSNSFRALKDCSLIVELHEWDQDAKQRVEQLIERSSSTHLHYFLRTGQRDLTLFPELQNLDDNTRWLLCSEGRPYHMRWVVFGPKLTNERE